jgi:Resolvase, N terminal domain
MRMPIRPAAYIRIVSRPGAQPPARQREAIIEVARDRGWPEPVVYADDGRATADGYGPALAMLSAAIGAGRHDMVIMPGPGVISRSPAHLMAFLFRCTHHGVAVEFLSPATGADAFLMRPRPAPSRPPLPSAAQLPAAAPPARSSAPAGWPATPFPPRCAAGTDDVLTRAGVEALTRSFPDWRIWTDEHGWHGRRRGNVYVQAYQRGAPAFCVHGVSVVDLAAQLRWQQAVDVHAPAGCSRR